MAREAVEQLAELDLLATGGASLQLRPRSGASARPSARPEEPTDPQESLL